MSWTQATFLTAFDEEAGDAATLSVSAEKTRWWNEGQSRLPRHREMISSDIDWTAGDVTIALPTDFVDLERFIYADGSPIQDWRVFGKNLVLYVPTGATADGSAIVHYWGEWPDLASGQASLLPGRLDYACLYYALHRFFRKLSSNRALYNRYSTLLGANAVTMADLQAQSDRSLQDYLDARSDDVPPNPSGFYAE